MSIMAKNSNTSQGALRKNCTRSQEPPRTGACKEMRANPRTRPATVPIAIDMKLIARLNKNPVASNGVHLMSKSNTGSCSGLACTCATASDAMKTASSKNPTRPPNNAAPLERSAKKPRAARRCDGGRRSGSITSKRSLGALIDRTPERACAPQATA